MGRTVVEEKSGKVVNGHILEGLDWKIQDFIEFRSQQGSERFFTMVVMGSELFILENESIYSIGQIRKRENSHLIQDYESLYQ